MPMIGVHAHADLSPPEADEGLGHDLTHAGLRAAGVTQPGPFHLDNTAAISRDVVRCHATRPALLRSIRAPLDHPGRLFKSI
jgi:hypothetical protein